MKTISKVILLLSLIVVMSSCSIGRPYGGDQHDSPRTDDDTGMSGSMGGGNGSGGGGGGGGGM